jgi:hypothetical protein
METLTLAVSKAVEMGDRQAAVASALNQRLRAGHFEMVAAANDEEQAINPRLVAAASAARAELGEEIDMAVYDRLLERMQPLDRRTLAQLLGAAHGSPTTADRPSAP